MNRAACGLAVVAVVFTAGGATAQPTGRGAFATPPDWAGHPPPVGDLFGYSPLVRSVDPFPSRSSGYAYSMFLPRVGGKRLSGQPAPVPRQPVVIHYIPAASPPTGGPPTITATVTEPACAELSAGPVPTGPISAGLNPAGLNPAGPVTPGGAVGPVTRPFLPVGTHRFRL